MTTWTDVIGWTLVYFLWEGTLIALVAAVALRALHRASAQARYLVACSALLLALVAPLLTSAALTTRSFAGAAPGPRVSRAAPTVVNTARAAQTATPAVRRVIGGGQVAIDAGTLARLFPVFVTVWVAGVVGLTTRLAWAWWRVRRLHAEALGVPASAWLPTAARLAARLGLSRPIHVIDSDAVDTPAVVGWLRPVVLLPIAALTNLSPGQVEAILAHELAHVRRHDFVVNLLQTLAETVLFYHPAVWWLSSRIRMEREHCCDDIAVAVCGDPIGYAEALTTIASRVSLRVVHPAASPLAIAAAGGSLLQRVRRLLRVPADADQRRPRAPFVVGAAVLLVVLVGMRIAVVAQDAPSRSDVAADRPIGPQDLNRLLGFDLFPPPAHYPTDDPRGARAWDVKVAFPGGEIPFLGFTARGLIRYAWDLGDTPVMDGPAWLDSQSMTLRAETTARAPADEDIRPAVRAALERRFGISVRKEVREVPILALVLASPAGELGPGLQPSTVECLDGRRARPADAPPSLIARGQLATLCGIDNGITGPTGYRVTIAEFARSLRGLPVVPGAGAREVIDQTGLTGEFDLRLRVGLVPLAAIATAHYQLARALWPIGIRPVSQAIEEQLGLRLVPTDAPRDIVVVATN